MQYLMAEVTKTVDKLADHNYHHALSSLIASDGGETVVVNGLALAELVNEEPTFIQRHGGEIAALCSRKFKYGLQPWHNWHVVYMQELRCFVGVRRNHFSLK